MLRGFRSPECEKDKDGRLILLVPCLKATKSDRSGPCCRSTSIRNMSGLSGVGLSPLSADFNFGPHSIPAQF